MFDSVPICMDEDLKGPFYTQLANAVIFYGASEHSTYFYISVVDGVIGIPFSIHCVYR